MMSPCQQRTRSAALLLIGRRSRATNVPGAVQQCDGPMIGEDSRGALAFEESNESSRLKLHRLSQAEVGLEENRQKGSRGSATVKRPYPLGDSVGARGLTLLSAPEEALKLQQSRQKGRIENLSWPAVSNLQVKVCVFSCTNDIPCFNGGKMALLTDCKCLLTLNKGGDLKPPKGLQNTLSSRPESPQRPEEGFGGTGGGRVLHSIEHTSCVGTLADPATELSHESIELGNAQSCPFVNLREGPAFAGEGNTTVPSPSTKQLPEPELPRKPVELS